MLKQTVLALTLPVTVTLAVVAHAQAPAVGHATLGKNHLTYGNIRYKGFDTLFADGVVLNAPDYDLTALTVDVAGIAGKSGPQAIAKIVAEADLARHRQVIGHFNSVTAGRYYTVYADHAVYAPDNSRPGGGTLDLTGHPKIIVRAPDILQEPSTTTFNDPDATVHVLLGREPDYPQVEGGAGQTDFTPLK